MSPIGETTRDASIGPRLRPRKRSIAVPLIAGEDLVQQLAAEPPAGPIAQAEEQDDTKPGTSPQITVKAEVTSTKREATTSAPDRNVSPFPPAQTHKRPSKEYDFSTATTSTSIPSELNPEDLEDVKPDGLGEFQRMQKRLRYEEVSRIGAVVIGQWKLI